MSAHRTVLYRGLGAICLVLGSATVSAAETWVNPFTAGDPARYPQPHPVDSVPRVAHLKPHPSLAALAPDAPVQMKGANKGARIELLQVMRSNEIAGTPAPAGMEAVILVTRWHNIHPKQQVPRAQLESAGDRTQGAGGLFGGGGKPDPKAMVELDVAYQVRQPGQHLWLVTGGETHALHAEGKALPSGVGPLDILTLARFGESREARFGWFVPLGSRDIELRFFDYDFGSIQLPVAGNAGNAAKAPALRSVDSGRLDELELAVLGSRYAEHWNDTAAPAGWRYLVVDLLGKSIALDAGRGALLRADPTRYLWAAGEGGALYYGQPPAGGDRVLVFTPEVPHRQQVAFLVPAQGDAYRVGIRGRKQVLSLRATATEPATPVQVLASVTDDSALELGLLGLRWDDQLLVVDLLATPVAGGKGVELDRVQQFLLQAGDKTYRPDPEATARLFGQPPTPFVLPPGTAVRFQLAYTLPAGAEPTALRYRGFSAESLLKIEATQVSGNRGAPAGLLAAAVLPTPQLAVAASAEPQPGIALGAPDAEPAPATPGAQQAAAGTPTRPAFVPPKTPPKLMPLTLPPFDPQSAQAEQEPNDKREQANPLGKALAAKGTLSAQDRADWFTFEVSGEPQLWSLEALGPGLRYLTLQGVGGQKLAERTAQGGAPVRIDYLHLLPGRYWLSANNSTAGGEYQLRAVPTGRPDRDNEFEPNDHPSQALVLRFGEIRRGLIAHPEDRDSYRFALDAPAHLALTLTPPSALQLAMTLQGGPLHLTGNRRAQPGESSRYQALLPAGDYLVTVHGDGKSASDTPYTLQLEGLDPFAQPVDLEPNDSAAQARSLGSVRRFEGSAGEFWDEDWFRLPVVTQPTAATIRFTGGSGLSLQVAKEGALRSGQLLETARNERERHYTATLEPGVPAFLRVASRDAYAVELALSPEADAAVEPTVDEALTLKLNQPPPTVAAFRRERQQLPLEFTATNQGAQARRITLESAGEAEGWRLAQTGEAVTVGAGASATLRATLVADADRVPLTHGPLHVRARAEETASAALVLPVTAQCGVAVQSPGPDSPLPETLLGGINVAWQALGAEPVGDSSVRQRQAQLFDGLTPLGQSLNFGRLPDEVTVRLAGGPLPVAGIALFPSATRASVAPVPFTLLTSTDGATFNEAFRGVLQPAANEQLFALVSPVNASHARLRLEHPEGVNSGLSVALTEFKVIAAPGESPFGATAPNIADPVRGGHVVWVSWPQEDTWYLRALLTEAAEKRSHNIDPLVPLEWVVGFHHQRAARVVGLEWQDHPQADASRRRPAQVTVAASIEGPNGPWVPVANWTLARDANGMARLDLPSPLWARYLRFSVPSADKRTYWQLAETLRVREQPTGEGYRSILGEWGHYRRAAFYERQRGAAPAEAAHAPRGGTERKSAALLAQGTTATGHARVGEREEWYRIAAPKGLERLALRFGGDGRNRLVPFLEDAQGNPVELIEADEEAGQRVFHAPMKAGSELFLKVTEAPRSIMIAWDNSGSTSDYHDSIYRAITRLADDVRPGQEVVNMMPLGGRTVAPLLKSWSSNPVEIKAAIGGYDRSGASSDAESTLLAALGHLSKQPGNRAILLLTDAESPGGSLNADLWRQFRATRPRIFTMELQIEPKSESVSHYQDLMQAWAAVNHGEYRAFRSQSDLDHAFDRAACLMRRPADYTVAWQPAPGEGQLRMVWDEGKAMAGAAMELVLDASGSMRSAKSKVNGKLKMEVAREVMHGIINALPEDTQVGLRFYGHRRKDGSKGACEDSELVAPITRLDRKRLNAAVDGVKALGSTPIAYSVAQACRDLAGVKGPKLLVVITDGKEECKGDPAAAVAACRAQGLDVRVDIVGFALADAKDKRDMETAAAKGGGRFFDAQDRGALAGAIAESLAMPFEVFDSREQSIVQGLTGQQGAALYQGNYSVIVRTATGEVTVRDVAIQEKKITTIHLAREGDAIRFRTEEAR